MCAVLIFLFSEEEFSTGAKKKTDRRMNTEHMGRENGVEPKSLAFIYKDMIACITSAVITFF